MTQPTITVFFTSTNKLRAKIEPNDSSPAYEVTVGGQEWEQGKGAECKEIILAECRRLQDEQQKLQLTAMQVGVAAKIREAEKAAYAYFCACPVGPERTRASEVYENVRNAMRVG